MLNRHTNHTAKHTAIYLLEAGRCSAFLECALERRLRNSYATDGDTDDDFDYLFERATGGTSGRAEAGHVRELERLIVPEGHYFAECLKRRDL